MTWDTFPTFNFCWFCGLISVVSKMTTSEKKTASKDLGLFPSNMRKNFSQSMSTGTGIPERLWSLLPWRYSKPIWMWSYATCSRWICFSRGAGLGDFKKSFPISTILWFCGEIPIFESFAFLLEPLQYKSKSFNTTMLRSWALRKTVLEVTRKSYNVGTTCYSLPWKVNFWSCDFKITKKTFKKSWR